MHRWGFVGTGDISSRIIEDLLHIAPGAVTGVWGRTAARADDFAATHGIAFATSSRDDLFSRDDIDVVYIATPASTHSEIALEALAAGKHVLVEKPMATTASDVARIFDAAAAAGRFAMEAMWMRFNPLHVEIIDRISDGLLGEVTSVRASFGTPFRARGNALTPAQGGSYLLDRGIYPITLAQWFLGEPVRVDAGGTVVDGVDLRGHATLESSGDRFAQIAWSGVEFLDLSATVSGERGWVSIDPMFWAGTSARLHAGTAEKIFVAPERIDHPRAGNGYRHMLSAVDAAVEDGLLEHPWHGRTSTLSVARTMDATLTRLTAHAVDAASRT